MRYSRTRFNRDSRLNENSRRRSRSVFRARSRFNEHRSGRFSRFDEMRGEEFWGAAADSHKRLRDELLREIKRKKARDIYPYYWFWFVQLNDGEYKLDDVHLIWDGIVNLDLGHPDLETAARKFGFNPWDFIEAEELYGFDFYNIR